MKTETDVAKRNAMIRDALIRTRDEFLFVPLHHQIRPWAMIQGVTTVHRSDDRPGGSLHVVEVGGLADRKRGPHGPFSFPVRRAGS